MQNYAPKPSYLKPLVLLGCALSLSLASTASLSQSIEELEAEAIRQKQATQATEEAKRKAAKAEAERKAMAREAAKRQAALATYPLTINTVPANAKVSIRNIEPKYRDGMRLPSGPYQVRVEAAGYETEDKWVELGKAAKILTINLEPKPNSTTTRVSNRADAMMIGSSEITTPMPVRSASTSSQRVPFEPEMVSISAGSFTMGCVAGRDDVEGDCAEDEKPPHTVSLPAFQIGKYEVTFDEWDACERAKACPHAEDQGWGRGRRPVINVNWNDITQNYIPWLNQQTGKRYRLPTEAEWEYAARAGGESAYPWGKNISCAQASYGYRTCQTDRYRAKAVGSYAANAWGLHDTSGNVWEWVQDWYNSAYYRTSPTSVPRGSSLGTNRIVRGGSWVREPLYLRSAHRAGSEPALKRYDYGFRLVLD